MPAYGRTVDAKDLLRSVDRAQLEERLVRAERLLAAIEMDRHAAELAVVARFRYASDAEIAKWAEVYPNEQAMEIARLNFTLAREQAKSEEIGAAHSALIQRLQTERAAISLEDFGKQYG